MASQAESSQSQLDKYSRENRWFYSSINGNIDASSRKLLEEYSKIPAKDVDSHIYKMVLSHPYPFLLYILLSDLADI